MKNFRSQRAGHGASRLLILLACVALLAAACSKADNTNSTNTSSTNKNSSTTSTSTTTTSSTGAAASPIAAYKAFQDANKKRDYAAVKQRFSKASLAMLEEQAKKEGKTLDEYFKQQVDNGKNDEVVSNEKINGDTGSVDIKDPDGKSTITLPMVKEDGEWKIAYDKFLQNLKDEFEKMGKEMEKKNSNSASDEHDAENSNH